MIVDCHTHIWESADQLNRAIPRPASPWNGPGPRPALSPTPRDHLRASRDVDVSIVLGFTSRYLGVDVPTTFVADYIREHPDRMVGFAGIDPTDAAVMDRIREARDLGMKGLAISPASQNVHPTDTRTMRVYEEACRHGMPVYVQQGIRFPSEAQLGFANPAYFDEVAREFAELKIVIAHMGYPWIDQTLCLAAKHANIFADISGILRMTWRAYTALLTAYEYEVTDKLLFGSDFPFASPTECIKTIYKINVIAHEASLPNIPRELLRGIIERDALALLGIPSPAPAERPASAATMEEDDEELAI